jgi:hypothetical protein
MTGQLEEEKMQVYVRLGIRLLYKVRHVFIFPLLFHLLTSSFIFRALRVEWKVHEVSVLASFSPTQANNPNL